MTYTTAGYVRQGCGHRHRTIKTAQKCADRDHRACAEHSGYSDLRVVRTDGEPFTDDEMWEWEASSHE